MSVALRGCADVTSSHSQTWSVLVSMGRMLTQEFLPHFLSVVLNSKHWLQGEENSLFGHPKIHKMTSSCVTDFSAAPSPNTHDLSKPLLYILASWVLYLQKAKTFLSFAFLVCHVSSFGTVPPPVPGSKNDSQFNRDLLE